MPRDKNNKSRIPKKQTAAGRSQPNPKRRVARMVVRRDTVPRGFHFFDANDPRHLPLPCRVAPYVVQRFIVNFSVSTHATLRTVVLVGGTIQQNITTGNQTVTQTDVVALYGNENTIISSAGVLKSPDMTALVTATTILPPEVTISATSVNILCVTNATKAAGQVWLGRSHGPLDLPDPVTSLSLGDIAGPFIGRPGVRPMSYYQLYNSHNVHAIPMDVVKYQDFNTVAPGYPGQPTNGFTFDGGMTPLILVFSPSGSDITTYNLRISLECRVRYPTAHANSSLHSSYPPTPQSSFDSYVAEAEQVVGGVIDAGMGAMAGVRVAGVPGAIAGGLAGFYGRQGRMGPRFQ